MRNIRSIPYRLKTRKYDKYESLVHNVGTREEDTVYPFGNGYELFTLGLSIGYANNDDKIKNILDAIEKDNENQNNDINSYNELITFQQLLDGHPEHAYTIDLIHSVICVELAVSENSIVEATSDTWNLVIALADRGVAAVNQEWKSDSKIALLDRMEEFRSFWQEKSDSVAAELSQIPQRDEEGKMQAGT